MCEYLGYQVTKLKRTRIMNVTLGNLKPGQWRNLTEQEMAEINRAVASSSKTAVDTALPKAKSSARKTPAKATPKKIFVNKSSKNSASKTSSGKPTLKLKRR